MSTQPWFGVSDWTDQRTGNADRESFVIREVLATVGRDKDHACPKAVAVGSEVNLERHTTIIRFRLPPSLQGILGWAARQRRYHNLEDHAGENNFVTVHGLRFGDQLVPHAATFRTQ
jgi:hypothetical protein